MASKRAKTEKITLGGRTMTAKTEENKTTSGSAGYLGAERVRVIRARNRTQEGTPMARWWLPENDGEYHLGVKRTVDTIEQAQTSMRMNQIKFHRMYGNYDAIGYPTVSSLNASQGGSSNRVSLNIVQSVIDAVAAKIAKDQPKVSFVTTGADDYFLKLRAQNLTKYVSGQFKKAKVYENSELVFRDAAVVGTGYLKVFEEDSEIKTEWVPNNLIRVDDYDGLKQKPRSMHEIRIVPRDGLIYRYPDMAEEIAGAGSALAMQQGRMFIQTTVDMVWVVESWHLPTTKDSKDGVHCITLENCTLFSETYEKDYFPIVPFRWMSKSLGFPGRSITEEILTIQVEINKILRTIQQSQELIAVPLILVPNGSEIAEDSLLDNSIARMVNYSGNQPPSFLTPTGQNPEVYQHLNSLIQWAFQIVGLSQTSASGMKPGGVDSAVAIREVSDIETGRFAMVALRWEAFFVEIARILVDMSKDLYTENPDLAVNVSEKKILREIKWKDVDLEENPFEIQTFPTSQLPDTPAGRIQTITEYIQNQWISKEKGMELLNLDPDLESEVNIQTSSLRLTEKWLSEMVEDGTTHKPEPYMNLQLALTVSQGVYTQLCYDNCPEDRLQLVRQWILDIIDLMNPPAPPPEQGPPPGAPAGPPGAPPGPGGFMPGTGPGQAPMAPAQTPMTQTQQ